MIDPDYRWSGEVSREEVLRSMEGSSIAGGYVYDSADLTEANCGAVGKHVEKVLMQKENLLTKEVRRCIEEHTGRAIEGQLAGGALYSSEHLIDALSEIPILAIRKYAYEHAFAYYMLSGDLEEADFDKICDAVGELAEGYKVVQYLAAKYSHFKSEMILTQIFEKLASMDMIESSLKGQLAKLQQKTKSLFV